MRNSSISSTSSSVFSVNHRWSAPVELDVLGIGDVVARYWPSSRRRDLIVRALEHQCRRLDDRQQLADVGAAPTAGSSARRRRARPRPARGATSCSAKRGSSARLGAASATCSVSPAAHDSAWCRRSRAARPPERPTGSRARAVRRAAVLNSTSARQRSGKEAASRSASGPPSAKPRIAACSDPAASMTAQMSATWVSRSGRWSSGTGSERPVPRRSKMIRRPIAARRRRWRASSGISQNAST